MQARYIGTFKVKIHVIDRTGKAHELEAVEGEALMNTLSSANLVEATCGGACSCATCQVYVDAAWLDQLPPVAGDERQMLPELLNSLPNSRLACQVVMTATLDGIRMTVAPEQ